MSKEDNCNSTGSRIGESTRLHCSAPLKPIWELASPAPIQSPPPPAVNEAEARRVAGELVKLHENGIINGADDKDAVFYAVAIRMFKGSVGKVFDITAEGDLPPSPLPRPTPRPRPKWSPPPGAGPQIPKGYCPVCWSKWGRALRPGSCICSGHVKRGGMQ